MPLSAGITRADADFLTVKPLSLRLSCEHETD